MKFHVLTLFPDMIINGLSTSIIGRAVQKELISIDAINIRDYTTNKHGKVDDYTYGGGAGMLMQAQPVYDAWKSVVAKKHLLQDANHKKVRTIYVTPQGKVFNQKLAAELAKEDELVFLCGHYEGIDERVLEEVVTDYISIGDYVLTGGELPAMVMIDAIARLIPGVLNNDFSACTESFYNDLLEYPQYTRPVEWHNKRVPDVLLSGNHSQIMKWRLECSKERTLQVRPDLYWKFEQKDQLIKKLSRKKRRNIHMMEVLRRGMATILHWDKEDCLLFCTEERCCMLIAENTESAKVLLGKIPVETKLIVACQDWVSELISQSYSGGELKQYNQTLYTQGVALPIIHKNIQLLSMENEADISVLYPADKLEYVRERINEKTLFGVYDGKKLIGCCGINSYGNIDLLTVESGYREKGVGKSLLCFCVNYLLRLELTPYCHVEPENVVIMHMLEQLGFYASEQKIYKFLL